MAMNPMMSGERSPEDSLGGVLLLKLGRIQAHIPALGFYQVITDQGVEKACPIASSGGPIGTRSESAIPVGSHVAIAGQFRDDGDGEEIATILGVVRMPSGVTGAVVSDHDSYLSRVGFVWDRMQSELAITKPDVIGVENYADGGPGDAVAGEWGQYSPMGPAVHVGHFMSYLRASDRCGVWAFTLEEMLLLAARSVQQHTLSRQYDDLVDEGAELNTVDCRALLPWEALGANVPEVPAGKHFDDTQGDPRKPPEHAPVDCEESDITGIFRDITLHGYLADLERRFIAIPDTAQPGVRKLSNAEEDSKSTVGVFDQTVGADGSYSVRSAKSLSFEKYTVIPVPHKRHEQWDPNGDTPDNTKFSGNFGEGELNERQDYLFGGGSTAAERSVLGLELHGFAARQQQRNMRGRKDWVSPEESETKLGTQLESGTYPGYKLEPKKSWMALPKYVEVDVQKGRWEKVRYYASRAGLYLMDDGSVMLEDGYGAQLIFGGGNAMLTAPNDVIIAPGRSIVQMAPQDLILKAGNSLDATASNGDVRLKAEKNLQMLGANGGEGGVLIESRSTDSTWNTEPGEAANYNGIVLKSEFAPVCMFGSEAFIHSTEGDTVIRSRGDMHVLAKEALFNLGLEFTVAIGDDSQDFSVIDPANLTVIKLNQNQFILGATAPIRQVMVNTVGYTPGGETLAGLILNGAFVWDGNGVWNANIQAILSLEFSGGIASLNSEIDDRTPDEDRNIVSVVRQAGGAYGALSAETVVTTSESWNETANEYASGELSYRDQGAVMASVSFSLRTSEDYGLLDDDTFRIPQWRWQQYALQEAEGELSSWEENPVMHIPSSISTMPWPGKELWDEKQVYLKVGDARFFQDGFAAADDGSGETESLVDNTVLSGSYIVNTFKP